MGKLFGGQPKQATQANPKEEIQVLVEQGILYEEEFIVTYMNLLKENGFPALFGEKWEEAKQMLDVLIDESEDHKKALESVKDKFQ